MFRLHLHVNGFTAFGKNNFLIFYEHFYKIKKHPIIVSQLVAVLISFGIFRYCSEYSLIRG